MNFGTPSLAPVLGLSPGPDSAPFVSRNIRLTADNTIVLGLEESPSLVPAVDTTGHGQTYTAAGKASASNGLFTAASLSPKHAEIWIQDVGHELQVYIRDSKSASGTYIDGLKLGKHPSLLDSGSVITLGVQVSRTPDTPSNLTDDQLKPIVAIVTLTGI